MKKNPGSLEVSEEELEEALESLKPALEGITESFEDIKSDLKIYNDFAERFLLKQKERKEKTGGHQTDEASSDAASAETEVSTPEKPKAEVTEEPQEI